MKSNDQIKFEAESCRFVAFIVGTPAGKIILEDFTEGIRDHSDVLALRVFTLLGSWLLYLYFMKRSVRIMEGVRS